MPEKVIVITSIFEPTTAVKKFALLPEWELLVVGDKKTPSNWSCRAASFLSAEKQEELSFETAKHLPWNHYARKNLGYLYAMERGASMIADSDDDNIPATHWSFPDFHGRFESVDRKGFVNIYSYFTSEGVWPRGFPLDLILRKERPDLAPKTNLGVGVWQGLADGDPDVDAVYRLTSNKHITFEKRDPIVLKPGAISPFNSQNTLFRRELFALLYLPAYVTFRFTDILRGLVAQPIMWKHGFHLGVTSATVFQERNPHDYLKDFESEIPVYLQGSRVVDIVSRALQPQDSIEDDLLAAYQALHAEGIVPEEELPLLVAWIKDLRRVGT